MDQQPLRLSDYVKHLAEVALPVQARSLETLRRVDVEALTNTELATIMYRDPALCISLLARAAALQKRPENRIATVDQAILLLGTRGSLHWALQRPVAEQELDHGNLRVYMDLVANAIHASLQATAWAVRRYDVLPAEIRTGALIRLIGQLCLLSADPKLLREVVDAEDQHPYNRHCAAYAVLGFTLSELSAGLIQKLRLPVGALEQLLPDRIEGRRMLGLSLAASLTDLSVLGPQHPDMKTIVEVIARYNGMNTSLMLQDIGIQAREAAAHPCAGNAIPWRWLCEPPSTLDGQAPLLLPGTLCLAPRMDLTDRLMNLCRRPPNLRTERELALKHSYTQPVDSTILLALKTLHHGLGLARAIYFRLDPADESIRPYMTLGCDGNPLLPELFLTVSAGSRLRPYLRDGQWMRLGTRQLRDLLGVTHHPSHRVFVCEQALIAPIRTADGLQGLLYADQGSNDCGLHKTAVQGFPDTCHALETGLSHLHLPQLLSLD